MHILVLEDNARNGEALRVRLASVCPQLEMVSVSNCWAALFQLKRTDVHWDLVILFSPTIPLIVVDDLTGPLKLNVGAFINTMSPKEGGYHLMEYTRDRGINPRLGVLCGCSQLDGVNAVGRIQAAGAVAVEYIKLVDECALRLRGS